MELIRKTNTFQIVVQCTILWIIVSFATSGSHGYSINEAILPDINATAGEVNKTYHRSISSSIEYVFQYSLNMSSMVPAYVRLLINHCFCNVFS